LDYSLHQENALNSKLVTRQTFDLISTLNKRKFVKLFQQRQAREIKRPNVKDKRNAIVKFHRRLYIASIVIARPHFFLRICQWALILHTLTV